MAFRFAPNPPAFRPQLDIVSFHSFYVFYSDAGCCCVAQPLLRNSKTRRAASALW